MIKQLTVDNHKQLMTYLYPEAAFNLFIIGDIEQFGYDKDYQKLYGEFDGDKLHAVLLQYRENLVFYSHLNTVSGAMIKFIDQIDFKFLSGKAKLISQITESIKYKKIREMYFSEMKALTDFGNQTNDYCIVQATTEDDIIKAHTLLQTIDEFNFTELERYLNSTRYKIAPDSSDLLYLVVDDNGRCIATATTAATNSLSTMILAVATAKDHRNKGLASALVSKIGKDYVATGRTLCLFYDNPAAGSIYERLGFKRLGRWIIVDR